MMASFGFIDDTHLISVSRGRHNLKIWDTTTGKVVDQVRKINYAVIVLASDAIAHSCEVTHDVLRAYNLVLS